MKEKSENNYLRYMMKLDYIESLKRKDENQRQIKYEKLLEAYSNAKDDPIDFALELTEKFGYLKEFLKTFLS